jgi:hypothetical protein
MIKTISRKGYPHVHQIVIVIHPREPPVRRRRYCLSLGSRRAPKPNLVSLPFGNPEGRNLPTFDRQGDDSWFDPHAIETTVDHQMMVQHVSTRMTRVLLLESNNNQISIRSHSSISSTDGGSHKTSPYQSLLAVNDSKQVVERPMNRLDQTTVERVCDPFSFQRNSPHLFLSFSSSPSRIISTIRGRNPHR